MNYRISDTFFSQKKLFIPLIFALMLFLIDKIFALNFVRSFTETRIEFSFYNEKKELFKQLQGYNFGRKPNDELLVIFGTSHMGEFSNDYIRNKKENLTTYNFSAPFASPSYLYYYLETLVQSNIKIDYAVLEIAPDIFTDAANDYALKFSYNWQFMFENRDLFSSGELEKFAKFNLFATSKYPVRFQVAWNRFVNSGSNQQLETLQSLVRMATIQNNGGIPNPIIYEVPDIFFEKESRLYFQDKFSNYTESKTQRVFFEKFVEFCNKNQIKLLLYKAIVSPQLQVLLDETQFYKKWMRDKREFAHKKNIYFLDMDDYRAKLQCKKFIDVHHISGGCYDEITDILLTELSRIKQ